MAQEKFSDFSTVTIAQVLANPQASFMYVAGVNTFSNENIKVPLYDMLVLASGAIIENGTVNNSNTYTITSDSELDQRDPDKIFIFISGQEGYTGIPGTIVDVNTGIVTFPFSVNGDIRIIIFR